MSFFKVLLGNSNPNRESTNEIARKRVLSKLDEVLTGKFSVEFDADIFDCIRELGKQYVVPCILVVMDKSIPDSVIETITMYPSVKGSVEYNLEKIKEKINDATLPQTIRKLEFCQEFFRICCRRDVMEKIGEIAIRFNQGDNFAVACDVNFAYPPSMMAEDRRVVENALKIDNETLIKICKGEYVTNEMVSRRNITIKHIAKNNGLLTFIVYIGMLILLLPCVSADNCVFDRTLLNRYDYCNNDTRTVDYVLHANNISSITCVDTQYTNLRFSVTNTGYKQTMTKFVGGNSSTYDYLKCLQNGVESATCAKLCDVETHLKKRLLGSGYYVPLQNTTHALCKGDYAYCVTTSGNSTCFADGLIFANPDCYCESYKLTTNTKTYKTKNGVYCEGNNALGQSVSANDAENKLVLITRDNHISDAYVELQGDIVYAKTRTDCNCFLEAKKDGWSTYSEFVGSEAWLRIENIALIKSGTLYVMIRDADGETEDYEFPITGQVVCRVHDCIICMDAFRSFKCLPYTIKAVIILFFLSISLLLLCLFPMTFVVLGKFIMKLLQGTLFCAKLPVRFYKSDFMKKVFGSTERLKDSLLAKEEGVDVETRSTSFRAKSPLLSMLIMSLLIVATSAHPDDWGCAETTTIDAVAMSCFSPCAYCRNNCSATFTTELTFDRNQQKLCRKVVDQNRKSIGLLEISMVSVEKRVDTRSIYYTSDYRIVDQSAHRCYDAGTCSNTTCAAPQSRSAGGELSDYELTQYPGQTICERRAGGWENGCGLLVDGCVFSGFAIIPGGKVYQVYDSYRIFNQPHIFVNYTTGGNNSFSYRTELTNLWSEIGQFEMEIEGELDDGDLDFQDFKVVTDGSTSYLTYASNVNVYNPNIIGDIQANSADNLEWPGVAFGYDPKMITMIPQGRETLFEYSEAAMKSLRPEHKLPRQEFGMVWSFDSNNQLRANTTSFAPFKILMKTKANFTFWDFTAIVCPKILNVSGSGCYDCSIGANVNVTVKSLCDDGLVEVSTDSDYVEIKTKSVQISKAADWTLIEITTSKESTGFYLTLIGTNTNDTMWVEFTAVSIHDVVDNKTLVYDNDPEEPSHSGILGGIKNYFDKALLGFGHWTSYLVISLIVSAIVFVIFMLFRRNRQGVSVMFQNLKEKVSKVGGSKNM